MFHHIEDFQIECPKCGKIIEDFQTKDTICEEINIKYWECDHFYSPCDYCNTWIDFKRKKPKPFAPIDDYEMKITESNIHQENLIKDFSGKIIAIKGNKRSDYDNNQT